jgi:hypothetical protein
MHFAFLLLLIAEPAFPSQKSSPEDPAKLLDRAAKAVELFFEEFPFYACTESVTQEIIGKKAKTKYKEKSIFDYLVISKIDESGCKIEESRLEKKIPRPNSNRPSLLKTNGFASMALIFHPLYRKYFEYRSEKEPFQENWTVLNFRQLYREGSTSALMLQGRIYPLTLQGTAEINNQTGFIKKITAELAAPMREINIESIHIEVEHCEATSGPDSKLPWLPSRTIVDLQTARQHWRNTHIFSNYRRFSVYSWEVLQSDKRSR